MTDLDKLHAEGMALLDQHDAAMVSRDIDAIRKAVDAWCEWEPKNIRALLEGIAAMRRERDAFETLCAHHLNKRDALQRDLDAALADARRYRWLRAETAKPVPETYSDGIRWTVAKEQHAMDHCFSGERLDAAIDAAINQEKSK
jgi:hypothetical protein